MTRIGTRLLLLVTANVYTVSAVAVARVKLASWSNPG